jgi:hypothetical protein
MIAIHRPSILNGLSLFLLKPTQCSSFIITS